MDTFSYMFKRGLGYIFTLFFGSVFSKDFLILGVLICYFSVIGFYIFILLPRSIEKFMSFKYLNGQFEIDPKYFRIPFYKFPILVGPDYFEQHTIKAIQETGFGFQDGDLVSGTLVMRTNGKFSFEIEEVLRYEVALSKYFVLDVVPKVSDVQVLYRHTGFSEIQSMGPSTLALSKDELEEKIKACLDHLNLVEYDLVDGDFIYEQKTGTYEFKIKQLKRLNEDRSDYVTLK